MRIELTGEINDELIIAESMEPISDFTMLSICHNKVFLSKEKTIELIKFLQKSLEQ